MRAPHLPRPSMIMLPSGVTLLCLFFGIFAIVSAARGDFGRAVLFIVFAGVCDALDGRVARATRSASQFGSELDSLVDAISFGVAPAMIMYFAVLHKDGWDWLFAFGFIMCAVIRLARFNVEQAGRPKTHFRGLPSPAAGGTLASYYWFSQTPLYNETMIGELPWYVLLRYLMAALAFLMVSDVPYPAWPTFSLRTWRGIAGLVLFISLLFALIFLPREFFFAVGMAYVLYGLVAAGVNGLLDRGSQQRPPLAPADEDAEPLADDDESPYAPDSDGETGFDDDYGDEVAAGPPRRRRRKRRRGRRRPDAPPHDRHTPPGPSA